MKLDVVRDGGGILVVSSMTKCQSDIGGDASWSLETRDLFQEREGFESMTE